MVNQCICLWVVRPTTETPKSWVGSSQIFPPWHTQICTIGPPPLEKGRKGSGAGFVGVSVFGWSGPRWRHQKVGLGQVKISHRGILKSARLDPPLGEGRGAGVMGWCFYVQGSRDEITGDTFFLAETPPVKSYYQKPQIFRSLPCIAGAPSKVSGAGGRGGVCDRLLSL